MNEVKLHYRHIFDPPALTACGAELEYALRKGVDFVIDFATVEFIGSPFIGTLVKISGDARRMNLKIFARNVNAAVLDLLERTAVTKVIEVMK